MASVTAVIPVHNRADLLAKLLAGIHAQTAPFARVLAIDNASTDDASAVARNAGCEVIAMNANSGFAKAVNAGIRASSSEWVAILNSDVELAPDWLAKLLEAAEPPAAFLTGTILDASKRDTIDGSYDLVSRACCAWRTGHGAPHRTSEEVRNVALAPGTACLYRRSVLEEMGGFDEEFRSYLEDIDLGLRLVRAGYSGKYVPSAVAWHHGSATFGKWDSRVVRLIARNQILLLARHYDAGLAREWWWPIVAGQLLWGLVTLRHGAFLAWLGGKREGLKHLRFTAPPSDALRAFVLASESEIARTARDPYWRIYSLLTSSPTTAGGSLVTGAH